MTIATCADCGTNFEKRGKSTRCADCRSFAAPKAEPADDSLLESLCRTGACFAEIAMNRLGDEQKMAAAEMLEAGAKVCVVTDLAFSDHTVSAARLYIFAKGAKPVLLGTLAAIGSEVRPAVLN